MRTFANLALAVVFVLCVAAPASGAYEVHVTDEMLRHTRLRHTLFFADFAYSAGVLLLILLSGLSRRMRDAAARVAKQPFVIAMLYLVMFIAVATLLQFPLSFYADFVVPHQFGLTQQSFAAWITDYAKALAVSILLGSLLGALGLWALRRVRRWWLAIWIGVIPVTLLLIALQPLVIDPLFNKFEPLRDVQLRTELLDLASRAGIEGGRVYQVDRSKQTSTMNAYVNGIGPTTRIVMWDTLLAKMNRDEVLTVMGHEMGHFVKKHIWIGTLFGLAIGFPLMWIGQRVHDRGLARWGAKWGVAASGDPAEVPWLLLILTVGVFLILPVIAGFSRYQEHQADVFALEMTGRNEAFATAFIKLAEDSKHDPDPHPLIEFWLYSHPSIKKRIDFALSQRR